MVFHFVTCFLVTLVFAYIYRLKGREYFLWWTWGWTFETARSLAEMVHESTPALPFWSAVSFPLASTSLVLSSLLFLLGIGQLCGASIRWRPLGAAVASTVIWSVVAPALSLHWAWAAAPGYLLSGGLLAFIGSCLLSGASSRPVFGGRVLGVLFLIWGFHVALYPLARHFLNVGPYGEHLWPVRFAISTMIAMCVATFMIVYVIEEGSVALREAEERFRRVFIEASECIVMADPATGEIVNANRRALDLSGYSFEELREQPLSSVLIDPVTDPGGAPTGRWIPGGNYPKSAVLDMRLRHRDGRLIPVSITRTLIEVEDGAGMVLIHLRDETESQRSRIDLQIQFDRLRGLHQISMALSKALDENRIHQIVFDQVRQVLPLDVFAIDLYRAEENDLRTVYRAERVGREFRQTPGNPRRTPSRTLFETVIRDRQPVLENLGLSQDTDSSTPSPDVTPSSTRPGSRMFVPMIASDEVLGVLSIQSNSPSSYDSSMLDLFQNLGHLAATALGNSSMFFREHEHSERMRFLKDLGVAISSTFELAPRMETAQNLIAEFLHADLAVIYLYDAERETLAMPVSHRRGGPPVSKPDRKSRSEDAPEIARSCFATGQPLLENNAEGLANRNHPTVNGRLTQSCAAVPITQRGRPIGVLRVDDCRTSERFERTDLDFLLLVSKQLATAVENARVFEELKRAKEHFHSLVELAPTPVGVIRENRIEYANPALKTLLGLGVRAASPCLLAQLVDPGDLESIEAGMEQAGREKSPARCEVSLIRPDGSQRHCEAVLSSLPGADTPRILALFNDRSESYPMPGRPKTETGINAVETLLTGIAGDFSALFSGILGQTAFLKIQLPPGERITQSIDAIEETALRASEYVKQVLTLRENRPADLREGDLSLLMKSLLHEYAEIRGSRFAFSLETAKDLRSVRLPQSLFHLAFTGLLNALVEVFPTGSSLRILLRNRNWSSELGKQIPELSRGTYVEVRIIPQEGEVSARDLARIVRPLDKAGSSGALFGLPLSTGLFGLMGAALALAKGPDGRAAVALLIPAVVEADSLGGKIPTEGITPLPLEPPTPTEYDSRGEVATLREGDPG